MNEPGIIVGFALLIFNGFSACAHRDEPIVRLIALIASFIGFVMIILSVV